MFTQSTNWYKIAFNILIICCLYSPPSHHTKLQKNYHQKQFVEYGSDLAHVCKTTESVYFTYPARIFGDLRETTARQWK